MSDGGCSGGQRNLPLVLSGIVGSWTLAMGALTRYSSVHRRLPWGRYSSDKELTDKWYCRFMDVSHGGIDQVAVDGSGCLAWREELPEDQHLASYLCHHGGASTNQVIEGSVHTTHTETEISQHNAEHVEGDDPPFEFEPAVQAAIGREFTRLLKDTLPAILDEALRKAKESPNTTEGPVVLPAAGGPILVENVAPPTRGCDYKAFCGCDPPELNGEKEAADTLDWINGMESTISLSDC
ncbi:hypothetical protein L1987_18663 [Smallanthus sonchifolius]|uniref:Uncharacterized protein n=1 Tax=Smallanthus sonchifolius TaxID=185202 RepID=A0ACB9J1W5_9ASTR|nr:hypothetical protein L1987_18663 [Smallanthus sonchifolius]